MSRRMKDSGIKWLGEIPAHWEVKRLKHVATINDEVLSETTDPNFRFQYIDIGSVDSNGEIANCNALEFENAPSRARRKLREGDVLVSTVRTYLRAIASVNTERGSSIASTGFAVVRPRNVDNRFVGYSLRSDYFVDNVVSMSVGVSYPAINANDLGFIAVSIPPLPEQRAIADYLDAETERIDNLIDNQRRLVDLLRERRQAIIAHAVSKGLDDGVAMRDSGIEWLGEIPAHWEVKRLKHLATVCEDKLNRKPDNSVYVGLEDMESWSGRLNVESDTKDVESNVNVFSARDVLFGKLRPYLAKVAIAPVDGVSTTEIVAIRAFADTSPDFLFYRLSNRQFIDYADGMTYGAKMPRVSPEQLGNSPHPIPPLPEQRAIADYLDAETAGIDTLVSKLQRQIELLTERRQAVITAAVTGKLDVGT